MKMVLTKLKTEQMKTAKMTLYSEASTGGQEAMGPNSKQVEFYTSQKSPCLA